MQPFEIILIVVSVIAGGALGGAAGYLGNRERSRRIMSPVRSSEHDAKLQHPEDIRRLLIEKKKIQAIKLYRVETGTSLREAKEAVERMETVMRLATIETHLCSQDIPGESKEEIKRLLILGMKINAIKAYRDATGVGLKEAKAAVDRMEVGGDESSTGLFNGS